MESITKEYTDEMVNTSDKLDLLIHTVGCQVQDGKIPSVILMARRFRNNLIWLLNIESVHYKNLQNHNTFMGIPVRIAELSQEWEVFG